MKTEPENKYWKEAKRRYDEREKSFERKSAIVGGFLAAYGVMILLMMLIALVGCIKLMFR